MLLINHLSKGHFYIISITYPFPPPPSRLFGFPSLSPAQQATVYCGVRQVCEKVVTAVATLNICESPWFLFPLTIQFIMELIRNISHMFIPYLYCLPLFQTPALLISFTSIASQLTFLPLTLSSTNLPSTSLPMIFLTCCQRKVTWTS